MYRSLPSLRTALLRRSQPNLAHHQPLSTSSPRLGLFVKERDDTLDPSKEGTDVTEKQAKNPDGANPAMQQAKITKQQGPGQTQEESRNHQRGGGAGGDGDVHQAGLSKKSDPKSKSGEEAVNPAVKQ